MEHSATKSAEKLLKEMGINQLPIDPLLIAREHGIEVRKMPSSQDGVSGIFMKVKNNFGILYATHIDNSGYQRFSICHELGHYFLPGHHEIVLSADGIHASKSGFISSEEHEIEADNFASGLLMPTFLFDQELEKRPSGLEGIIELSEVCRTSLTATAIRYAYRTPEPAAIVVSVADKVQYCFMSDELREYPGLSWIKKNSPLRRETLTFQFNKDKNNIINSLQTGGKTDLITWFGGSIEGELHEEVIGLGSYDKTLTILTALDLPDPDEYKEDERLKESWTPRFKR